MYILDTDTCIAFLAGKEEVKDKIIGNQNIVFTTSINIAELYYGAYKSSNVEQNIKNLEKFINNINIIEFDVKASNYFGRIKTDLEKSGQIINDSDLFIASIALSKDYLLITQNIKHFEKIKELKIEDWLGSSIIR